jgi:hypothetical protein
MFFSQLFCSSNGLGCFFLPFFSHFGTFFGGENSNQQNIFFQSKNVSFNALDEEVNLKLCRNSNQQIVN